MNITPIKKNCDHVQPQLTSSISLFCLIIVTQILTFQHNGMGKDLTKSPEKVKLLPSRCSHSSVSDALL